MISLMKIRYVYYGKGFVHCHYSTYDFTYLILNKFKFNCGGLAQPILPTHVN